MTLPETDFESLPALVAQHARQRPAAPALVCGERRWCWRELDERAALREAWSDAVDIESLLHTDDGLSFGRPGHGPDERARRRRLT